MSGLMTSNALSANSSCPMDPSSVDGMSLGSTAISAKSSCGVGSTSVVESMPVADPNAIFDATSVVDSMSSGGSTVMSSCGSASAIKSISCVDSKSFTDSIPALAKSSWLRRLAAGWTRVDETDALHDAPSKTSWLVCWTARRR